MNIQDGWFGKKFKVKSQIWLNKFQKSENKSKFRLAEIFSNFP